MSVEGPSGRDAPSGAPPRLGEPDDVATLRAERDAAATRCRELEHEIGELRGRVKRLELVMWRRTERRKLLIARINRVRAALSGRRS